MGMTYEVKVTRQALEQMQEITHYIAHELCAPDAAYNLLDEIAFGNVIMKGIPL